MTSAHLPPPDLPVTDDLPPTGPNSLTVRSSDVPTLSAGSGPIMTLNLTPGPLITVFSDGQRELARVERDGRVVLSYEGAEELAAKAFWSALQSCGTSLIAHTRELERRLAAYETVVPFPL